MDIMRIASLICAMCAAVGVFFLVKNISETSVDDMKRRFAERATTQIRAIKYGYFSYDRLEEFLWRKGGVHMFGRLATPLNFILLKVAILLFVIVAGITSAKDLTLVRVVASIAGGIAATFIPDVILSLSDDDDNKQMLPDIRSMYDTLRIEMHAGVFMTDAIGECYFVVKNKRLKAALIDLTNEIVARNNIDAALSMFQRRFDNQFIDMFAVTLRQALESGRGVEALSDVSNEIDSLQKAINANIQEALDRKIQILQLLLFVAMMAVMLYAMGASLMHAVSFV